MPLVLYRKENIKTSKRTKRNQSSENKNKTLNDSSKLRKKKLNDINSQKRNYLSTISDSKNKAILPKQEPKYSVREYPIKTINESTSSKSKQKKKGINKPGDLKEKNSNQNYKKLR